CRETAPTNLILKRSFHPAVLLDAAVSGWQESYSFFQADRGRLPADNAKDGGLHLLPVIGLELVMAINDKLAPGVLGGSGQHNGALLGLDLLAVIRHALLVQRLTRLRADQVAVLEGVVPYQLLIGTRLAGVFEHGNTFDYAGRGITEAVNPG